MVCQTCDDGEPWEVTRLFVSAWEVTCLFDPAGEMADGKNHIFFIFWYLANGGSSSGGMGWRLGGGLGTDLEGEGYCDIMNFGSIWSRFSINEGQQKRRLNLWYSCPRPFHLHPGFWIDWVMNAAMHMIILAWGCWFNHKFVIFFSYLFGLKGGGLEII